MSKSEYRDYFVALHTDGRMVKIPVPANREQLGVLQSCVGGFIEHVVCPGGRMSDGSSLNRFIMIMNEDGRSKNLPPNTFARLVAASGYRIKKEDVVTPLGVVVIACSDKPDGWYGGIHESVEELLLSAGCRWKDEPTELTLQVSISLEHDSLASFEYVLEVRRIFTELVLRIPPHPQETVSDILLHDTNGNLVGTASIKRIPIKK